MNPREAPRVARPRLQSVFLPLNDVGGVTGAAAPTTVIRAGTLPSMPCRPSRGLYARRRTTLYPPGPTRAATTSGRIPQSTDPLMSTITPITAIIHKTVFDTPPCFH